MPVHLGSTDGVRMTTSGLDLRTVQEKASQYRNWGKWGPADVLGTVNYVTADKVAAASRLRRSGTRCRTSATTGRCTTARGPTRCTAAAP